MRGRPPRPAPRITTVLALSRAWASRDRWVAVSTSVRIPQHAGGGHDHVGRHREAHVEAAVLEVELALAVVLLGVPAADVVVDREAGIPLRHLVGDAAVDLLDAHPVAVGSEGKRPARCREPACALGGRGRARSTFITVPLTRYGSCAAGAAGRPRAAATAGWATLRIRTPPSAPPVPKRLRGSKILAPAALAVERVLVQLEPEIAQRIGRVVAVGDPLLAADRPAQRCPASRG